MLSLAVSKKLSLLHSLCNALHHRRTKGTQIFFFLLFVCIVLMYVYKHVLINVALSSLLLPFLFHALL